jgi:type VI secretion system protein ImpH
MDASRQQCNHALAEELLQAAGRFDFFQVVRLAQRLSSGHPVGYDHLPEIVRFKTRPSLTFPPSSVAELRRCPHPKPGRAELEVLVTFLGLIGPAGVLPHHYTRLVIERVRQGDFALRDFLDLFNHRLIALFYRAWQKYCLPAAYEQFRLDQEQTDPLSSCFYSLVGLGTEGLRKRSEFDDEAVVFFAGLFSDQHRPAVCLPRLLADYFEVPVTIEQWQGRWLSLNPEDRSVFPDGSQPDGRNLQLGIDTILGEQVWDVQGMFRVRIGPLTQVQFRHWIPTGDALRPLCQFVRTYVGMGLEFEVQVTLQGPEVPPCQLGGPEAKGSLLGWTTWLLYGPAEPDRADATDPVFAISDI